jgi:hypothetical protein
MQGDSDAASSKLATVRVVSLKDFPLDEVEGGEEDGKPTRLSDVYKIMPAQTCRFIKHTHTHTHTHTRK